MTRARGRICVSLAVVVAAVVTSGSLAGAKGGPPTLTDRDEVVFRTNGDHIRLRVVTGNSPAEFEAMGVCDGPGCLPKRCQPVRAGYLAASTREVVGEGYFDIYRTDGDEPVTFVAGGNFGGIVDRRVGWVVAQVAPSVARVDASFVNGGRDSVEPKEGFAVLASPVEGSGTFDGQIAPVRLVARDAKGEQVDRLLVRRDTEWQSPSDVCDLGGLPATFPEPTGRVPADSAVAQAAVIDAFLQAYGGAGVDGPSYVVDGDSLREVAKIASDRYPDYTGNLVVNVAEVRFVDEDEAAVRFEITVPDLGGGAIVGGIGTAVLRDGRWLVGRDTFCTVLAVGGVYCPVDEPA